MTGNCGIKILWRYLILDLFEQTKRGICVSCMVLTVFSTSINIYKVLGDFYSNI